MTSPVSTSVDAMSAELLASRNRLDSLAPASAKARALSRLIGRLGHRLVRPPRIVLLGEFNSGKSTLANALIGADVLPTSIHANTRLPVHIRYSPSASLAVELADHTRQPLSEATFPLLRNGRARMLHVGLPVARLKTFELIDTPGLASGMTSLDCANLEACNRAGIAIWCTASTQAWKATERAAWDAISPRLRRRGLLVATLADTLNTDRDRARVEARLRSEACPGFAGLALVAAAYVDDLRRNPDTTDFDSRWIESGGAALDAEVQKIIDRVLAERVASTGRVLARIAARHDASPAGAQKAA